MKVRYIGWADVRNVTSRDIAQLGVEAQFADLNFDRGGELDVPDAVGQALLSNPAFAGQFVSPPQEVVETPPVEPATPADDEEDEKID